MRGIVARHPVASFLVLAYTVTAAVSLVPYLTRRDLLPLEVAPYDVIASLVALAAAAFVVTWAADGPAGVRDLALRSVRWKVGLRWYALALLAVPTLMLVGAFAIDPPGTADAIATDWPRLLTHVLPQLIVLVLFLNWAEEIGFTGFLFARLQVRHGALKGCLIVGVFFSIWHIPFFVVETGSILEALLVLGFLFIPQLASRFIVGWIYNSTGHSLLLVGLFHATFNGTVNSMGLGRQVLGMSPGIALLVANLIVVLGAVVILVATKGKLSETPAQESRFPISDVGGTGS